MPFGQAVSDPAAPGDDAGTGPEANPNELLVSTLQPGWKFADLAIRVARFARRPTLTLPPLSSDPGNTGVIPFVSRMIVLDLAIRIGVIWLTLLGTQILDTDSVFDDGIDPWLLVLLAVIIAPLLEETAMRLLIHPWSQWRFWVSTLVWLTFVGSSVFSGEWSGWQGWLLLVWPVGLIVWRLTNRAAQAEAKWNRGSWVVWVCVIGFALAHVANYDIPISDWRLITIGLLVVPQLIGGLFIAYTRIRAGFWAGVAHHAISNALLVVPAAIALSVEAA